MATATYATGGREMTIGGVFARALAAVGAAPAAFFGTSFALVALPSALIGLATRSERLSMAAGAASFRQVFPILIGTGLVWWLLYMAAQAMLFRVAVGRIDGRPGRLGDDAAAAARALLPLIGLSIVLTVAVWLGMIVFIVPGIMVAIMWSVAAPVLVVERVGVFTALGRSGRLTKGARWRVFGLVVVVFGFYFMASSILGLGRVMTNGSTLAAAAAAARQTPPVISTIFSIGLQTVFVAMWTAVQAALYADLRDWKDGPAGDRLADIFA